MEFLAQIGLAAIGLAVLWNMALVALAVSATVFENVRDRWPAWERKAIIATAPVVFSVPRFFWQIARIIGGAAFVLFVEGLAVWAYGKLF